MLVFEGAQLAEYYALYELAQKNETAVAEVDKHPDAPGLLGDGSVSGEEITVCV